MAMDGTKPYEFIGFGAMDGTKPYEFIGFGAMEVTKPYEFIGFGDLAQKPLRDPFDRGADLEVLRKSPRTPLDLRARGRPWTYGASPLIRTLLPSCA